MFLGGAAVGSLNCDDAAGDFPAVGKMRERPAVLIDRGDVRC